MVRINHPNQIYQNSMNHLACVISGYENLCQVIAIAKPMTRTKPRYFITFLIALLICLTVCVSGANGYNQNKFYRVKSRILPTSFCIRNSLRPPARFVGRLLQANGFWQAKSLWLLGKRFENLVSIFVQFHLFHFRTYKSTFLLSVRPTAGVSGFAVG